MPNILVAGDPGVALVAARLGAKVRLAADLPPGSEATTGMLDYMKVEYGFLPAEAAEDPQFMAWTDATIIGLGQCGNAEEAVALASQATGAATFFDAMSLEACSLPCLRGCDALLLTQSALSRIADAKVLGMEGAEMASRALVAQGVKAVVVWLDGKGLLWTEAAGSDFQEMAAWPTLPDLARQARQLLSATLAWAICEGFPREEGLQLLAAATALLLKGRADGEVFPTFQEVEKLAGLE